MDRQTAFELCHLSVKPGNGAWIARAVMEPSTRGKWEFPTGAYTVENVKGKPRKRETARAKRKAALKRHEAWCRESMRALGNIHERNERRAEAYARWLCERDGIKIPHNATTVKVEHGWIDEAVLPDAHWLERQRIKAVQFGRMVENDAPAPEHLHGRALRRWRANQQYKVFRAELTVEIPHWDHVPVCIESDNAGADIVPFAVAAE